MPKVLFLVSWLAWSVGYSALHSYAAVYGHDLKGRPVASLGGTETQAVVLFFLATDCPISNRYAPEIQRLEREFAARPVAFWLVYPNATETGAGVQRHMTAYGLTGRVLLHPDASLIASAGVTVTPESAVMMRAGEDHRENGTLAAVYSGRIDDRYVDIGRQRPQATRHDLEEAVNAVLSHQPVVAPGGPPIGCGIIRPSAIQGGKE